MGKDVDPWNLLGVPAAVKLPGSKETLIQVWILPIPHNHRTCGLQWLKGQLHLLGSEIHGGGLIYHGIPILKKSHQKGKQIQDSL